MKRNTIILLASLLVLSVVSCGTSRKGTGCPAVSGKYYKVGY